MSPMQSLANADLASILTSLPAEAREILRKLRNGLKPRRSVVRMPNRCVLILARCYFAIDILAAL